MSSLILFGKLFVANPMVRRNASILLSGSFHIHDPGATREELDNCVTKQTEMVLNLLLTGDSPFVRVATIQGVCRLLTQSYEIMPVLTCQKTIHVLIHDVAKDTSS